MRGLGYITHGGWPRARKHQLGDYACWSTGIIFLVTGIGGAFLHILTTIF